MDSATSSNVDWGAVALLAMIAAAIVWAFVFFVRQNRKDLDSLEKTLKSDSEENAE
ncbi:MAG: hypothetical protein H6942_15060 [Candidatus Accumulibacter sp.]|uniref:hypothetical protein n=1 Tax=Accumulibacter sp. TaxID=2053492 RepID=UPI0019F3EC6A|nr:hypothetical protein [Accumulibacter sp.]MBE2259216.1 hypothetical protein [Paracoccaceae bacterium]MCB1944060.1 hypothetical protein [Accumulibacter sp.]MCP5249831.1 hypothetical protein [Accumulibacter sp.]